MQSTRVDHRASPQEVIKRRSVLTCFEKRGGIRQIVVAELETKQHVIDLSVATRLYWTDRIFHLSTGSY